MIRVAVIGAGLIGRERLTAIKQLAAENLPVQLAGICDADRALGEKTAAEFGAPAFANVDEILRTEPDWVIVALPHDTAVGVALEALARGHSVLMEKPMGRDLDEARRLFAAGGDRLRIGFNYRFFPGIRRALQDARRGAFGKLIAANFILGHGGSPGQEKTWKLDPIRAGGGCLIDPGVHLLDLCNLLQPGGIEVVGGTSWAGFWKTGIEEDVQLILRGADGLSIALQISIVRWRSTFSLVLHGEDGYGEVAGRNRSYGPQTYRTGPRWGWQSAANQAASEKTVVQSGGLQVFADELRALFFPPSSSEDAWPAPCAAREALATMELLDKIREQLGLRRQFPAE
ncbi:MAG: Gfo/Idh/MocA family protein [Candidatus Binataceae bacterium]